MILGALLNAVYEARGRAAGRFLFLLDEVARLGYMGILETARDTGRKYGPEPVPALPVAMANDPDLGPGVVRFAYLRIFSHVQDYGAADFISTARDEFTVVGDGAEPIRKTPTNHLKSRLSGTWLGN